MQAAQQRHKWYAGQHYIPVEHGYQSILDAKHLTYLTFISAQQKADLLLVGHYDCESGC